MDFDSIVAVSALGALLLLPFRALLDEVRDAMERGVAPPQTLTEKWEAIVDEAGR